MSHYVYTETGEKVPPNVEVFTIPAGFSEQYPNGGSFTKELPPVQVTAIYDDADFPPAQKDYPKSEAAPKLQEQLDRIEKAVTDPDAGSKSKR